MIQDHQIRTLMLLHELEEALSDMYVVFSKEFPDHSALWNRLVEEEQEHAEAVRKLYRLTYQGRALFDEGTIKPAGVQSIIDYIRGVADAARRGDYSETQIASLSLDIEKSLLERKLFDHFKVSPEFAGLLATLREGSEAHAGLVAKEFAMIARGAKPATEPGPK